MSVNASSSLNITLVPPPLHSSTSLYEECLKSTPSVVIYVTYTFTNVLFLLPLYILILYVGFQRWRNQSSASARPTSSHSDVFTYHIIAVEILGVFGSLIYCFAIFTEHEMLLMMGMFVFSVIFPGQTLFHCLTCVERYLAVVHPIPYMSLRERGAVRVRNGSAVCAWLLCFGWIGVTKLFLPDFPVVPLLCMLGVSITVIVFCCISVLHVLTHSGPGEAGGTKERVDQSKQRAFHIICAILGVLLVRFVGLLVGSGLSYLHSVSLEDFCVLLDCGLFLSVPSSLVLPLLFLHKTGKVVCCGRGAQSG